MKNQLSFEDPGLKRMVMITPLLDETLDPRQLIQLKKKISEDNRISYKTIGRYLESYKNGGFEGLQPQKSHRTMSNTLPDNYPSIVEQAIILRRECATRSIRDIIRILEIEGIVEKDILSRSTLQRHMQSAGFGAKQVSKYSAKGAAARRFAKAHRLQLLQGDIKYGPYLPIGKNGEKKQVYLSVFIDDATRYIVAARFYDNQRVEIIEDSLRTAIMQFGKPAGIFVDNGKQYRSEWLTKACAKLEIRLLHSKPYHPEGKGKVEAFNRRIESFLSEVALNNVKSLEALNDQLDLWIKSCYHKDPHHGLGGISPESAFITDTKPLKFIDIDRCRDAFLHTEEREVDKVGCISFKGRLYEVGLNLIGRKVEVYYDPSWTDEVDIHHKDFPTFKVKTLQIGENCSKRAELPDSMQSITPESSRLLNGLKKQESSRVSGEVAVFFGKKREVL